MRKESKRRTRLRGLTVSNIGLTPFLLLLLFPVHLKADEHDFKVDTSNTFSVVEKKAVFNKYEGTLSDKKPDSARETFPGQKIFIRPTSEWGCEIVYDGSPLKGKYSGVDELVFSPDHKVALAYGHNFPLKSRIHLIDDQGQIYKDVDFLDASSLMVKTFDQGFIVLYQKKGPVNSPGWYVRLAKFDYSGNELWQKDFTDGEYRSYTKHRISVCLNGHFIVFSLEKKNGNGKEGFTYLLDGDGSVLDKLDSQYESVLSNDNETALLATRKNLRIINIKNKTLYFKRDLDNDSKKVFLFGDSDQADKVVLTYGDGQHLDEILAVDLKNKKMIRFDAGSKDYGFTEFFYLGSENKIVHRLHNPKDYYACESIDLEK
jgi:hypothetical protein